MCDYFKSKVLPTNLLINAIFVHNVIFHSKKET